jgi:phosphotransferase system HPr (HPr) family protein
MSGNADSEAEAEKVLPAHLHARPAAAVVRTAANFGSTVEVGYGEKTAKARSVLALIGLGALAGETVVVRATGPDAAEAVAAVVAVLDEAT